MVYDWDGETVWRNRRRRVAVSAIAAILTTLCLIWAAIEPAISYDVGTVAPGAMLRGSLD
jgi:hypothetical protein